MPSLKYVDHEGYRIIPLHYSMDPEKDAAWAEDARESYRRDEDWEQEMEINFETISGTKAYPPFSIFTNTSEKPKYRPDLPIRLACDFGVNPMAWVICQYHDKILWGIDEIFLTPGSVEEACDIFIRRYSHHRGELWIYGDCAGRARSQQNQRSNYDTMKLRFMSMPWQIKMKVPTVNPSQVDRMNAVNDKIKDEDGVPHVVLHSSRCRNTIRDCSETVRSDDGRSIKKVTSPTDKYFYRTHCMDGVGYLIMYEWPVSRKVARKQKEKKGSKKGSKPVRNKRLIGRMG